MSSLTNYLADQLERHVLGIVPYAMPNNLQIALYTSDDGIKTNAPTGEVSNVNYARQMVTFNTSKQSSPVTFPGATSAYTPTHAGLIDKVTEKILVADALSTQREYVAGEPLYLPLGAITLDFVEMS
jgi:hypothetical protein